MQYALVPGVSVESIGAMWAAFSPASGETAILNDASASILEVLSCGPADIPSICVELADDSGVAAEELMQTIAAHWQQLIDVGLVRAFIRAGALAE